MGTFNQLTTHLRSMNILLLFTLILTHQFSVGQSDFDAMKNEIRDLVREELKPYRKEIDQLKKSIRCMKQDKDGVVS